MRLLTLSDLANRFDFVGACREPIGALEPHVPWSAGFLMLRRDCYQATADPRLATATRDLDDYFCARTPAARSAVSHDMNESRKRSRFNRGLSSCA